jgi:uncharacterized membrane protein YcaP (DUF421 family)
MIKTIWLEYMKDWNAHSKDEIILQVVSIVVILFLGMVAIRLLGKKSFAQMTLVDVLFIFVLSSTLGALITKPSRVFIAVLVVVTIILFIWILEKLQLKWNFFERALISMPETIYENGKWFEIHMKRNNVTVDIVESWIRQHGYPSISVCKRIVIESTGAFSFELLPEWEPIKKIYFDDAIKQILKAINKDLEYNEIILPPMNNAFDEVELGALAHKQKIPKELE